MGVFLTTTSCVPWYALCQELIVVVLCYAPQTSMAFLSTQPTAKIQQEVLTITSGPTFKPNLPTVTATPTALYCYKVDIIYVAVTAVYTTRARVRVCFSP